MESKFKKIISFVFLIVLVLIVGFLVYKNKAIFSNQKQLISDQQVSYEFDGSIKSVTDNAIIASGTFLNIDNITRSEMQDNIQVLITPQTKIIRTLFSIPSAIELEKTNGVYEPEKLPKITTTVSVSDLKTDYDKGFGIGIQVKSDNSHNIFGLKSFEATEINYIMQNI